jgi:hypothetical protein
MKTLQQRFDESYTPEPNTGCWLWLGHLTRGYGRIRAFGETPRPAHRISYIIHVGPIPEGLHVLHGCNEASCVNPAHLHLGTDVENTADKVRAGRQARVCGESNGRAKLTRDMVDLARRLHSDGASCAAVARRFGIAHSVMSRILRGLRWKLLSEEGR